MKQKSPVLIILLLIASLFLIAGISYLGIEYFEFEPSGVQTSTGEFSLGVSSKLGWILTAGFVALMFVFIVVRRLIDKLRGRF